MPHAGRKSRRRAKLAKILARRKPAPRKQPGLPPGELLNEIAYAMNMAEVSGAAVELAHGAVITDYGYVLRLGDRHGERWQARTRVLTEFTPAPDRDDD